MAAPQTRLWVTNKTKNYFGPDRRRNVNPNYVGPERRKGGKADVVKQSALLDKAKAKAFHGAEGR